MSDDDELLKRLHALRKPIQDNTETSIESRFQTIAGRAPAVQQPRSPWLPSERVMSDDEQIEEIMAMAKTMNELDDVSSQRNAERDDRIQARMRELLDDVAKLPRQNIPAELEHSTVPDEEKIIKKESFQQTVPAQVKKVPAVRGMCTICLEKAEIKCRQCDGDLYCKDCFKECHQESPMREHVV